MSFTMTASRLAGLTALLLGWRPSEFWGATPTEVMAIWEAARGSEPMGPAGPPGADVLARLKEMFPDG